ncbi:UbiA family prenyltransferase [Actinoplanes sp. NPDC049548]|uniref:UbiA family prenyltransferase n=1 Tax=Actinoplanes sp. NPDC049548 TaxID=3155152 RepID=UPI0034450005
MSSYSEITLPRTLPSLRSATLTLCLAEARPAVLVIFLVRFLAGTAMVSAAIPVGEVAAGAFAWVCATFFVYLLNGATDVAEDQANGSRRPIASGRLSVATATRVAWTAAVVALAVSLCLNRYLALLTVLMLVLGYAYSGRPIALKRWSAASSAVTFAGGLLTYLAGFEMSEVALGAPVVVLAVIMSAWMGLVGIVVKDLSDVTGDRAVGRRTIAVRRGMPFARRVVAANALLVGGSFIVLAATVAPSLWCPAVILGAGAAGVAVSVLTGHSRGAQRSRLRRPYRVFMVTQYAAHAGLFAAVLLG